MVTLYLKSVSITKYKHFHKQSIHIVNISVSHYNQSKIVMISLQVVQTIIINHAGLIPMLHQVLLSTAVTIFGFINLSRTLQGIMFT